MTLDSLFATIVVVTLLLAMILGIIFALAGSVAAINFTVRRLKINALHHYRAKQRARRNRG